MPYNPAIPQANQRIRDSQPPILENFTVVNRAWNVNHGAFDTGAAIEGKHNWVTFPEQAGDPVTLANEVAIFAKESALTGVAELFLRQENNGTVYEWSSSLNAVEGWTRLPSGILLKWGLQAPGGATPNAANVDIYPVAAQIPVFTAAYIVLVSPYHLGADASTVRLMDWNTTQFRVYATVPAGGTNPGWTYLAIGT